MTLLKNVHPSIHPPTHPSCVKACCAFWGLEPVWSAVDPPACTAHLSSLLQRPSLDHKHWLLTEFEEQLWKVSPNRAGLHPACQPSCTWVLCFCFIVGRPTCARFLGLLCGLAHRGWVGEFLPGVVAVALKGSSSASHHCREGLALACCSVHSQTTRFPRGG